MSSSARAREFGRYVIDICIVAIALVLLLAGALGKNARNAPVALIAELAPPPALTDLSNMTALHESTLYSLDTVTQDGGAPRVVANRPAAVTIDRNRATTLTGWAVDAPAHAGADAVYVLLDGKPATSCRIGLRRQDVAAAYAMPAYAASGFSCRLAPERIVVGRHTVELDVVVRGERAYYAAHSPTAFDVR